MWDWALVKQDYKTVICCFSTKHTALRNKSKEWLCRNQNNVSECNDILNCRLLFQWASTIKNPTQCVGLVLSRHHHHLMEMKIVLVMIWLKTCWLGIKQQSITHCFLFIYLFCYFSAKPIRPGQHPGGSPATSTGIRGGGGGSMAVNGPQN